MKEIIKHLFSTLLVISLLFSAQSSMSGNLLFIEYDDYLIPVNTSVSIETRPVSAVTDQNATANSIIQSGNNVKVWFEFAKGNTAPNCRSTPPSNSPVKNNGDSYAYTYTNLIPNGTKYTYRACGKDTDGELNQGDLVSFSTTQVPVSVVTNSAISVSTFTAVGNGYVADGKLVKVWFEINQGNTAPNCSLNPPSYYQLKQRGQYFNQNFNVTPGGITYSFRACGKDNAGKSDSGISRSFTTQHVPTTISSYASNIQSNSFIANGKVVQGYNVRTWFIFGLSNSNLNCATSPRYLERTGSSTNTLWRNTFNGLKGETLYKFQFCAQTTQGTIFGHNVKYVTTKHDQYDLTNTGNNINNPLVVTCGTDISNHPVGPYGYHIKLVNSTPFSYVRIGLSGTSNYHFSAGNGLNTTYSGMPAGTTSVILTSPSPRTSTYFQVSNPLGVTGWTNNNWILNIVYCSTTIPLKAKQGENRIYID